MKTINKEEILKHYIAAALWTADKNDRDLSDMGLSTISKAKEDIDLFIEKAGNLLDNIDEEQIGHDFWLTRNHHGAGFWDRGLGEVGDKLTEISETFKELNVWENELNIVYFE